MEASSTPTICRLSDSRRHQLWAIALANPRRGHDADDDLHTAETPKQPTVGLTLRAPYLYPDWAYFGPSLSSGSLSDLKMNRLGFMVHPRHG